MTWFRKTQTDQKIEDAIAALDAESILRKSALAVLAKKIDALVDPLDRGLLGLTEAMKGDHRGED